MSRVPVANKTKTRLLGSLDGEECAELHRCFLRDLFSMAGEIEDRVDIFLSYSPEGAYSLMEDLLPDFVEAFPQVEGTLGQKMGQAIKRVLDLGYDSVILTGTDIPSIEGRDIISGFRELEERDLVLAPTMDGGYYLIGMKAYQAYLFEEDYKWGGQSVFEASLRRIREQGQSVALLRERLDIDTREDLDLFLDQVKNDPVMAGRTQNSWTYLEGLGRF